jgi:hypothetical protein
MEGNGRPSVAAFQEGATPEEIAQHYSTAGLADVYVVIGYCLQHREAADEYLRGRQDVSARTRREDEARRPAIGIRERLLARKRVAASGTSG